MGFPYVKMIYTGILFLAAAILFTFAACDPLSDAATPTPAPTASPSPVPTATPAPGSTATPAVTLAPGTTATPTPAPGTTAAPTATPSTVPGATATPTVTLAPGATATPTAAPAGTATPTAAPGSTPTPTPVATTAPTPSPTPAPVVVTISRTSACGFSGSSSVSVTNTTISSSAAWQITNNNWHAAPVFTFALGTSKLGDYAGLSFKVRYNTDMTWKTISLELDDGGGLGAIQYTPANNALLASLGTGSGATAGTDQTINLAFDLSGMAASYSNLTGNVQIAIGISGPSPSSYTIYDLALVSPPSGRTHWTQATGIKTALAGKFDYFGLALEYSELQKPAFQNGVARQADSITLGNDFKPDYILGSTAPSTTTSFTAKDGVTYPVPSSLTFTTVDNVLTLCKNLGLKMRGHVLVWHSQTPAWFFREGFSDSAARVNVATMNARLEWYIKSVLTHIKDWETANNGSARIITTWDVVNEAASDSATTTNWLRGSNGETSDWYSIYNSAAFIVNAFTYANTYAPSDVKLAYNDYNCYITAKTAAIVKIIDAIKAGSGTRLDVIGMQSHVSTTYPGVTTHQTAVQTFLAKGVDVQITEFDIHCTDNSTTGQAALGTLYKDYFTMFLNKRKVGAANGISGVTIWGLSDANTWLTSLHNATSYPLLFDAWYYTKPAYDGVIQAAGGL